MFDKCVSTFTRQGLENGKETNPKIFNDSLVRRS